MATDVLIIGGGPVGLYLAALLLQDGVSVRVLEQRPTRNLHSRAIGIHPPALEALDKVQIADSAIRDGVRIRDGMAVSGGRTVGTMSFGGISDTFPFVLALPQFRTEQLLEDRVCQLDRHAIIRDVRATQVTDDGGRVTVVGEAGGEAEGREVEFAASLVVAADGARSRVRNLLGVPVNTRNYPDHYLMGDFQDPGPYGERAVLFLEPGGIVESFPLPGGVRRWVVRLGRPAGGAGSARLAELVRERTGILPDPDTSTMVSAFSVRSVLTGQMAAGRVVLIGDAAHEISPIGGQGMNLGWLDAQALSPLIRAALAGGDRHQTDRQFKEFDANRRQAAMLARRQSEINMMLGRPLPRPLLTLRNLGISAAAATPAVNRWVARRFTMQ
ncbi:2-polyprenyl-6-methoxyphenol hydroxylase-like FAD-dependent oxidoreductase [Arthrobacter sp. SLBN-100]|uniref:FAD-dependent oxidoreductase n=1 Tax=Arthrobacter sp. SLBN-100 TaxID=2768450 RepID=UPI001151CA92|nr:NAD(P)/FAD-dependent oxidoreductase [Arthrobacter sp. SLBN-100]TQJ66625.1 2-polyprenyl-6-methoxyphenol hydroxylase-like FAD-dependent oxidoreductase [Arthrobacter sp. SLBN-100]